MQKLFRPWVACFVVGLICLAVGLLATRHGADYVVIGALFWAMAARLRYKENQ